MKVSDVKRAMQRAGVDAETILEVVLLLTSKGKPESNVVYFMPRKAREAVQK